MKLRHAFLATLLASSLGLSSCASVTGGALLRKGESPATLIVQNSSGVGIDVLTLSRCSALSYGLDRLTGSQSEIPNRTSMSITLGAGCWDIQVGRSGTCAQVNGGTSCSWLQSQPRRFNIAPGQRLTISYGPNG